MMVSIHRQQLTSGFNPVQAGFLFITGPKRFPAASQFRAHILRFNPVQAGFLFITLY